MQPGTDTGTDMSAGVSTGISVDGQPVGITTGGGGLGGDSAVANPVALLVHGAGMNRTVWQQQTRYLNHHGVCALAIDLPGHGNSGGELLQTVPQMAEWLVRLIDEISAKLGCDAVGLVGHSMGSLVCLSAAALAPDKVSHLVLAGTAMSMPVHPAMLDAAQRNEPLAGALMTAWGHGPVAHVATNPTPGMWMTGGGLALLDVAADDVIFTDLSACNGFDIASGDVDVAAVKCPVSFICGGADKMTPPEAAAPLAASFDGAQVHYLANVGHTMMSEDPGSVREILLAALSSQG